MTDAPSDADRLHAALEAVRGLVPYLRSVVGQVELAPPARGVPEDGVYVHCDALIGDPDFLRALIVHSGQQIGTDDPVVAASLFVQSYAYRILTLAIACATTYGVVPDSSARSLAIALKSGRVSDVAYLEPRVRVVAIPGVPVSTSLVGEAGSAALFASVYESALDGHLVPLVESVRQGIRVGERLLWGNVAASMAVGFRTMEGCLGEWVQTLGAYFVEHAPSRLQGLGSYIAIEAGGRRGWFWERTNCCLYDRLPGRRRCADCSRTETEIRRAAYVASLEGS